MMMMAGVSAMAQTATLGIRLTEPAGGTINSKEATTYTCYIKNVSTATITSGTKYAVGIGTVNSSNQFTPFGNPIAKTFSADLAVGDSVMTSQSFSIGFPEGMNQQALLCMSVYTVVGTSATFQGASCRAYTLYNTVTEIEKAAASLSVYPNPATEVINFDIDYNKASKVEIMDITGRLIETVSFNLNNAQVNVRNYNAGIYLYKVSNSEGQVVKTGKVTVNN